MILKLQDRPQQEAKRQKQGNHFSLVDRSRVKGFVDVDCVGEDGVVEANVHEVVHPVAGAVASRGAIRPIPELAAGTLHKGNYSHI